MKLTCLTYSEKDHAEHRLMRALLKSDQGKAKAAIEDMVGQNVLVDQFCVEVFWGNLPILIYQRICDLQLGPLLTSLQLSNGEAFLDAMRRRLVSADLEWQQRDKQFQALLEILDDLSQHVIWLKGTSLARTIYAERCERLSLDFDFVVDENFKNDVLRRLEKAEFLPVWNDPGYCHQFGVGPVGSLEQLFLVPANDYEGCHNLTLKKAGWPMIEIKFNPLDNGLRMKELERFFRDAEKVSWRAQTFLAPSSIDHLMLAAVHIHKHAFQGWGWLYDIHLLAEKISQSENGWSEVVRCCHREEIQFSTWKTLTIVQEQLGTKVPQQVLLDLRPGGIRWKDNQSWLGISTEFLWNCNGLPMLLLNAVLMGGTARKLKVLSQSFFPSTRFLSQYYCHGAPISWLNYLPSLFLHWLVLILPAGVIRRTFGPLVWRRASRARESA
jgi:hypothetical protein